MCIFWLAFDSCLDQIRFEQLVIAITYLDVVGHVDPTISKLIEWRFIHHWQYAIHVNQVLVQHSCRLGYMLGKQYETSQPWVKYVNFQLGYGFDGIHHETIKFNIKILSLYTLKILKKIVLDSGTQ